MRLNFDMSTLSIWTLATALVAAPLVGGAMQGKTPAAPAKTPVAPAKPPLAKPTPKATAKAPAGSAAKRQTPIKSFAVEEFERAKYEPARGAYLGAALDFSKLEGAGTPQNKMAEIMRGYEKEVGRKHALYVQFFPFPHDDGTFPGWDSHPWGWAPPSDFANATAQIGATPLLTLEPMKPRVLVDGWQPGAPAYESVKKFAQGVGAWKKPVFIRFAHEMNGSWYPWCEWMDKNRNMQRDPGEETGFWPPDYQKSYRNVALLFRKYAPNAALVWCPNSGLLGGARRDPFRPFYPGDDVVDWVGLDIYERGWTMPMPGARLWGGMLEKNMSWDVADDPKTEWNESVDFYKTFSEGKNKPMMIGETSATLSYRTDLPEDQRAMLSHLWRAGHWNDAEYGWLQTVYGTTSFNTYPLFKPIDRHFPMMKAIVWFHIAKKETIPAQRTVNGKIETVWFDDAYSDYRIGGAIENGPRTFKQEEISLFRRLTNTPYFLGKVQP